MDNVYDLKAYREMIPWKRRRVVRRWFLKKEVEKRERQEAIKKEVDKKRRAKFEKMVREHAKSLVWLNTP